MSDGGKIVTKADDVVKWIQEGETWIKRGREMFSAGFTSKTTEAAPRAAAFDETLLNGVEWMPGKYGEYVFSQDYKDLYIAVQDAGGKVDMGDFTVSIGKNEDYINKNPKKRADPAPAPTQGGGYQGQMKDPEGAPTQAQLSFLGKLGVAGFSGTKKQASDLIEEKLSEKRK
ncbi:MAG: hypothetical protein ABSA11_05625 [Candidatus Bathyarchaeia archaeon]|jgi:hypothetical protein